MIVSASWSGFAKIFVTVVAAVGSLSLKKEIITPLLPPVLHLVQVISMPPQLYCSSCAPAVRRSINSLLVNVCNSSWDLRKLVQLNFLEVIAVF